MGAKGKIASNRHPERYCEECGKQLERRKRSTSPRDLCAKHSASDPGRRQRISASITAKHADPNYSAKREAALRVAYQRMKREGHPVLKVWSDNLRKWRINPSVAGSEERRRATAKATATRLAHIPVEYRDEYRRLTKSDKMSAADATRMVLEQCDKDTKHFIATGEMVNMKRNAK